MNATTLETGRRILRKTYFVEAKNIEPQYKWLVSKHDETTQTKELYKQLKGFSMAVQTGDGDNVSYEDLAAIYTLTLTPVVFTKGTRFSPMMKYTDQYGIIAGMTAQFAMAHEHKKNQVTANMDNLGFTSTTYGVNSEALYSTSHDMGGVTYSNTPASAGAFGPNTAKAHIISIRKQKSAQDEPLPYSGTVLVKLPVDLEPTGVEVIKSMLLANTANNNTNEFLRNRLEMKVCDYYTSTTAHFYQAKDYPIKGTVLLDSMPYDIKKLEQRDEDGMHPWISMSAYQVGWFDAHGTYGDAGV